MRVQRVGVDTGPAGRNSARHLGRPLSAVAVCLRHGMPEGRGPGPPEAFRGLEIQSQKHVMLAFAVCGFPC